MASAQIDCAKAISLLVVGEHDKAVVCPNGILGGIGGFLCLGLRCLPLFGLDIVPEDAFCQIALHPLPCQPRLDAVGQVAPGLAKTPNERCRVEARRTAAP